MQAVWVSFVLVVVVSGQVESTLERRPRPFRTLAGDLHDESLGMPSPAGKHTKLLQDTLENIAGGTRDLVAALDRFPAPTEKRGRVTPCDTSQITINTIIEYLTTGRVCGSRVAPVRFGVGK